MRNLTAKQKKLLTAEFDKLVASGNNYPDYWDVDYSILLPIDNLNPCEIFSQNVDRLFDDLIRKRQLKEGRF